MLTNIKCMNNDSSSLKNFFTKVKFLPDIFLFIDITGKIIDISLNNNIFSSLKSIKIGDNIFENICFNNKKFKNLIKKVDKSNKVETYETEILCNDIHLPILLRMNKIDKDKFLICGSYLANLEMIQKIQENNENEKLFFKTWFDNSQDAIFIMNDEKFIDCNKKTLQIFGLKNKKDILLHHPADFSPKYQPNKKLSLALSNQKINEAFKRKTLSFEWKHIKKDKTEFDAQVSLNAVTYQNKKVILAIVRDISSIKKAERQIKEQIRQLQTQNEEIQTQNEEYTSVMHHLKQNQTELKLALQSLMVSEKKFRTLAEISPAAFVVVQNNKFVYLNESGYNMLGMDSPKELENLFFWDIVDPRDRELVKERGIKRQEGQDIPNRYEFRIINKKHGPIWIDFSAAYYPFEGKKSLIALAININERKLLDDKIKTQKENLEVTLQSIGDAVIVCDTNSMVINMNPVSEKLCGVKLKKVYGKKVNDVFHIVNAITKKRVTNPIEKVLSGKKIVGLANHTMLISNNKKHQYHIEDSASPIFKNDEIIGVVLVFRDITEKYIREQEIIKNEKLYRNIFEQNAMGTLMSDKDGNIVEINKSALNILGSPSEEATKKINILTFPPMKAVHFDKYFKEALRTKETVQTFFNYTSKWGKNLSIKLTYIPIIVNDEFVGMLITFVDISQEKEVERRLHLAKEKAINADKLKSAFLSNMSHEIRTPMNGILGFAQLLKNTNISETMRQKYIYHIQNSGKALLHLINDIIDLSKIEANELVFNSISTDLRRFIENLYDFYYIEIKRREDKHIKLDCYIPDEKEHQSIMVDSYRLRQVIDNLLSNAIKFTNTGNIQFGYDFQKQKKNKILFFIKDTGIGIQQSQLPYIFDRFTQGFEDNNKQNFGGTGLGLAISKKIVEQMGGNIWVESVYGEGSQFYFTIPIIKASKTKRSPKKINKLKIDWKDKTILVAEDDEISLLLIEEMLSTTGINVLKAVNGEEAINKFNENKIDILLLDIQMPLKNGLTVLSEVKKQNPNMPVLIQTAYALNNEKEICFSKGCNEYISKPLEYNTLIRKIQKYL